MMKQQCIQHWELSIEKYYGNCKKCNNILQRRAITVGIILTKHIGLEGP